MSPLETAVAATSVLTFVGIVVTVWVKLNNQIAVLSDRSEREDHDEHGGSGLIDELRRQIEAQGEEIQRLRREVDNERAARERQELRHNRELAEMTDQLNSVSQRLLLARQRLSGLDGQA